MKQYFVTGTNTNVGKTIVSALLSCALNASYFKPIQTGAEDELDSNVIKKYIDNNVYESSYTFKTPASPHVAAKLENVEIDLKKIIIPDMRKSVIVEGVGGCMVPINRTNTVVDLIKMFKIPVIIVAKNELGVINNVLTTLTTLSVQRLKIAGVILNGESAEFLDNKNAIEYYGGVEVLDTIKHIDNLNKESIKNYKLSDKLLNKLL